MYSEIDMPAMSNWYIDDNTGWFVSNSMNILYKCDMRNKVLSAVSVIPSHKKGGFQNPYCIKYKDLIYCIPLFASSIWRYNLTCSQWEEIDLCKDKGISTLACLLGEYYIIYYFFSISLKKIWGVDLKRGIITVSYDIDIAGEWKSSSYFVDGILVEDNVYLVLGGSSIYEFNLKTGKQTICKLVDIDDVFYKIRFDGEIFWIIGKKGNVYLWNKECGIETILSEFPDDFVLYDFTEKSIIDDFKDKGKDLLVYSGLICLNGKVWLIPQSGNKILYCSQGDKKLKTFEIPYEKESAETLDLNYRQIATKFYLMYVRKERFLGIYSYKNKRIFEIDTQNMTYENMDTMLDVSSLMGITIQDFHEDGNRSTYLIWNAMMENIKLLTIAKDTKVIGEKIYSELCR